jgi:FkbM family methyltransferase
MIRGGLNRAVPDGLSEVQVAAGMLAGLSMHLDLKREKHYWLGTYENELQAAIAQYARPGMVAYDCGANIGYITLALGRAVGSSGHVYAFEPLPANLARLRLHLQAYAELCQFDVVPKAVTALSGDVQFLVHDSGAMGKASGSAGRETEYAQTISVAGVSLDDFVFNRGNHAPDLIKMDIEGGEALALKGMSRVLAEVQPLLLIELHGSESAKAAWKTLTAAGYSIHRMQKAYPRVEAVDVLDWKAYLVALPPQR